MKIGDFGTGRTKERIVVRDSNSSSGIATACKIIFFILTIIMIAIWAFTEYSAFYQMETLKYVRGRAIVLPFGDQSITEIEEGGYDYDGQIVALTGVTVRPEKFVHDWEFELEFPEAGQVERIPEYCQWQEFSTTNEEVIGRDEDGKKIIKQTTEYYYVKDWRRYPISSLFFDNAVAYHNPVRDPFPGYIKSVPAVIGYHGKFRVERDLLKLQPAVDGDIPRDLRTTDFGWRNGVTGHDGKWVYSEYREGSFSKILKSMGTFFIDGVIDLGIKGKCNPGDVRVSWKMRKFYPTMTIIGKIDRANNQIVPFKLGGGSATLLSSAGKRSVEEVVGEAASDLNWGLWVARIFLVLIGCVFLLLMVFARGRSGKKMD